MVCSSQWQRLGSDSFHWVRIARVFVLQSAFGGVVPETWLGPLQMEQTILTLLPGRRASRCFCNLMNQEKVIPRVYSTGRGPALIQYQQLPSTELAIGIPTVWSLPSKEAVSRGAGSGQCLWTRFDLLLSCSQVYLRRRYWRSGLRLCVFLSVLCSFQRAPTKSLFVLVVFGRASFLGVARGR